ncbi:hypothetical protein WMF31_13160 [Sorangium sp. So ce1036]|uniref:hypothetical protein n=1 Tax=Sorangium TaxID=39643 RepID=UPI001F5C687E|nr:hypothetical protein [Sorangium cellulosum]
MSRPIVHDFTRAVQRLTWVKEARAYHVSAENRLVAETGVHADSLRQGLYLYLYSNSGETHPIRNKNRHHHPPDGAVICPPGYCTLKSGMFRHGLHEHIRRNVHAHLWRPDATPRQDHLTPQVIAWFLVFETDPLGPPPLGARQKTREKYYNFMVRKWLSERNLNDPRQSELSEHRWIPPHTTTPPLAPEDGRGFLENLLASNPDW